MQIVSTFVATKLSKKLTPKRSMKPSVLYTNNGSTYILYLVDQNKSEQTMPQKLK